VGQNTERGGPYPGEKMDKENDRRRGGPVPKFPLLPQRPAKPPYSTGKSYQSEGGQGAE